MSLTTFFNFLKLAETYPYYNYSSYALFYYFLSKSYIYDFFSRAVAINSCTDEICINLYFYLSESDKSGLSKKDD